MAKSSAIVVKSRGRRRESSKGRQESGRRKVPVVAVGASAGGLEALERFFDSMPADTGLAFVIVQHLSPDFRSMMDELLARHSSMVIRKAADGAAIEPNTIYLNPPRPNIRIIGNTIHHVAADADDLPNHPIDALFHSLASDRGAEAIVVILSGTGSDGTRGALAVCEAGGSVIVQEPGSAQFENMPRSAIDKGAASVTALPEEMARVLMANKLNGGEETPTLYDTVSLDPEAAILQWIDRQLDANFAFYKESTVRRRIRRRAALSGRQDLSEYLEALSNDPDEQQQLFDDLLIGVTAFFRDRAAFNAVESNVLPPLFRSMSVERPLRVWVPGCASGEEAYSIAILLAEHARSLGLSLNAKIFATDIHANSIEAAATGIIPGAKLKELDGDLRDRYFVEANGNFRVKPELRHLIIFSRHNLLSDPPFTNVDLISCRNVLIYFNEEAQRRALSLFHFALSKNGVLFLGPSETLGELKNEFEVVDSRWRIFRKIRNANLSRAIGYRPRQRPISRPINRLPVSRTATLLAPQKRHDERLRQHVDRRPILQAYDELLSRYAPASLLISRSGDLLHVFGAAEEFIKFRSGAFSNKVGDVIIEPLRMAVEACIQEIRDNDIASTIRQVVYASGDKSASVDVRGEPMLTAGGASDFILINFVPHNQSSLVEDAPVVEEFGERQALKRHIEHLERDLRYSEESLQTTIEELETSNEELQAANEELMSANEELQSTNEELHAVNEELYSISSEHQRKIDELTALTNDMDNLLRCTDVGMVFLDADLAVRRFTPAAANVFDLMDRDCGRPFEHVVRRFNYPTLLRDLRQVASTGTVHEDTYDIEKNTLLLRIFPFKVADTTKGVVLTVVDITSIREIERTQARLIDSLNQFTHIVSHDLRAPLRSISNSAKWIVEDLAGSESEEVRGHCERLTTYTRRLTSMLDDLRQYARVNVDEKVPTEIDLRVLLAWVVETLDAQDSLNLSCNIEVSKFLGHEAALRLVFQNLFENALKHGGQSVISIKVTARSVGDGLLQISVEDDGVGIPQRHQEKVFLPFRKLERLGGTGMGLALVKKAVEDNGGTIDVVSDPNERPGTMFSFTWKKMGESNVIAMADQGPLASTSIHG